MLSIMRLTKKIPFVFCPVIKLWDMHVVEESNIENSLRHQSFSCVKLIRYLNIKVPHKMYLLHQHFISRVKVFYKQYPKIELGDICLVEE